jgi:hypothetical protein
VLELRDLHLDSTLARASVLGEYVQDQTSAINDADLQLLLQVALLTWRELVVGDQQAEVQALPEGSNFTDLALAKEERRIDLGPLLNVRPDNFRSSGTRQVTQLVHLQLDMSEVPVGRRPAQQEGALALALQRLVENSHSNLDGWPL